MTRAFYSVATYHWWRGSSLETSGILFYILISQFCYQDLCNQARNFPIWTLQPITWQKLESLHLVHLRNGAEISCMNSTLLLGLNLAVLKIRKKIQVVLMANAGQSWATGPLFFLKTRCPKEVLVVLGNRATGQPLILGTDLSVVHVTGL